MRVIIIVVTLLWAGSVSALDMENEFGKIDFPEPYSSMGRIMSQLQVSSCGNAFAGVSSIEDSEDFDMDITKASPQLREVLDSGIEFFSATKLVVKNDPNTLKVMHLDASKFRQHSLSLYLQDEAGSVVKVDYVCGR